MKMWEYILKNIFHTTYFFENEIVDHVELKRHCVITKKNIFEFRVISTIYYGLSAICANSPVMHRGLKATNDFFKLSLNIIVNFMEWNSTDSDEILETLIFTQGQFWLRV